MTRVLLVLAAAALVAAGAASAKVIRVTTCGADHCRVSVNGISGVATLPDRVAAPAGGRFYTVTLRAGDQRWAVVYEARRQLVRALDGHARSFLGTRWLWLAPDVRPAYARAVDGLAPMHTPPHTRA